MMFRSLLVFSLVLSFSLACSAQGECSSTSPCPGGECCSQLGYCGTTIPYCCKGCQSNCNPSFCPYTSTNVGDLGKIISREMFAAMFPHRNEGNCYARCFYTYDAFIQAAASFPDFGNTGNDTMRKKEIAAFLAQIGHGTSANGPYSWGYAIKKSYIVQAITVINDAYPCPLPGKYYGRGLIQLSYNYNYKRCGEALGVDLRNNPELLITNPVLSFKSAIWFWMTAQSPKPSCHEVILNHWLPSLNDIKAGRLPGYGLATNIINGRVECGRGSDYDGKNRIAVFQKFCQMLGVEPGENLDCYNQKPYHNGPSLLAMAQSM